MYGLHFIIIIIGIKNVYIKILFVYTILQCLVYILFRTSKLTRKIVNISSVF